MAESADDSYPEPDGVVRVGVVDARVLVRQQLAAALDGEPAVRLVATHAGWPEVSAQHLGSTVWIAPAGPVGPGPVRRVDVDDLDVADAPGLLARLRSTHTGPPTPGRVGPAALSAREDAVLSAVAAGTPAAHTAAELGISTKAVQNARRRAITKLGAATQVEAVRVAHELRVAGVALTGAPPRSR